MAFGLIVNKGTFCPAIDPITSDLNTSFYRAVHLNLIDKSIQRKLDQGMGKYSLDNLRT